ncbi:MAG: starvation-sensing protein RspA [Acidobacteriaceae bacterium]|nr:starvation-sensing protein RspA [Acidobacteriaceae bacterium]MBV9502045.1 starvation-sensing protein RspA [Acidobacteriaceae bacterium]
MQVNRIIRLNRMSLMLRREFLALAAAPLLRGMPVPKIKDISVIATEPAGVRLIVVKIQTDQDGLYGYGCATFTQRADLVVEAVDRYLKPLLIGRPADAVTDTWGMMYNSSYWRNGPVLNNAISGVDQALWDIKGRQAGMPVYELLGGKSRRAAMVYLHASGREIPETMDQARKLMAAGLKAVRLQVGVPGMAAYGAPGSPESLGAGEDPVFDPEKYVRRTLELFEAGRKVLGPEVELLHDVHERVSPRLAVQFAKDMEQFRLFFLEDALSPENIEYFRQIRANCTTPLAMGELFNNPHEWTNVIKSSLIDYIRVHVSQAGGMTPALKIANLGEAFQVRTAWHGPGDVSPIGHCANVTLDIVCPNFGIQEWTVPNDRILEVFDGYPVMKDGYAYVNEKPGWGVEINEKAAVKYPFGSFESGDRKRLNGGWGVVRRPDGTVINQ